MKNYKLTIEYDGTGFYGWQRQQDRLTVQGELERVLSVIFNQETRIHGAGRTDAGVHAIAQVASFTSDTRISCADLKKSLNSMIKHPIVIHDCAVVPDDFHAQYSAASKEYHYRILNRETPCAIQRNFQWHVRHPLDVDAMNSCCDWIIGAHDFKSFENTGSPRTHTTREILSGHWQVDATDLLVFKIAGTGFLKYMVRNLVGTMVLAGQHKISVNSVKKILDGRDRKLAGPTAPAHGLFLMQINYP
ncbi:MAG: tRNA pseudouridine(38-40) synthase TruA [Desulfobacteraceae bacterium]|nr:MAG: tRNA pseudouridine(38-40) synthase TruA [Desulfobacteraceae bacterium]